MNFEDLKWWFAYLDERYSTYDITAEELSIKQDLIIGMMREHYGREMTEAFLNVYWNTEGEASDE